MCTNMAGCNKYNRCILSAEEDKIFLSLLDEKKLSPILTLIINFASCMLYVVGNCLFCFHFETSTSSLHCVNYSASYSAKYGAAKNLRNKRNKEKKQGEGKIFSVGLTG